MMRFAIVGAGPSGLVTAIALMKRLNRPFEAWLIDADSAPGAFGDGPGGLAPTSEPARDLSVLPDRPDDFADWLKKTMLEKGAIATLRGPQDLHVPRALFRDYVMARFGEALSLRQDVRIRTFRAAVRAIRPANDGVTLRFRGGESAWFDHVFVATGFGTAGREATSWDTARAAGQADTPEPLTLLGNGPRLAAILLHLRAHGFAGEIRVAATGGLPRPHGRGFDGGAFSEPPSTRSLADAFRHIRKECSAAEARDGGQWQTVVDAASARLSTVWRNLPQAERYHYRNHLLPLHRHFSVRIAREVHQRLAADVATGRTRLVSCKSLTFHPTRLADCRETPAADALATILDMDVSAMNVSDCGGLTNHAAPVAGLSLVGTIASGFRPGPFTFTETMRQAYRAVLHLNSRDVATALRG